MQGILPGAAGLAAPGAGGGSPGALGRTLAEAGAPEERLMNALGIQPDWLARYPPSFRAGNCSAFALPGRWPRDQIPAGRRGERHAGPFDPGAAVELLVEECARRGIGLVAVSHAKPLLDRVCTRQITL